MKDKPFNGPPFEWDEDMFKRVKDVVDRHELFETISPEVNEWLEKRGAELFRAYAKPADEYLTETLVRPPEREPLDDKARAFIWVAATRCMMMAPPNMNRDMFQAWCFALMSMGYVMRIDHESNSKKDGTDTDSVQSPETT